MVSYFFIVFKRNRVIYLLISIEFLVFGVLFFNYFGSVQIISSIFMFYLIVAVISRILGLLIFVRLLKNSGRDSCVFYSDILN